MFFVSVQGDSDEFLGGTAPEVEFARLVRGVPRAYSALEDDPVTRVEEHLGRAAGVVRLQLVLLEHKSDVADALPHLVDLPRASARLVVHSRGQVPCDSRGIVDSPLAPLEFI